MFSHRKLQNLTTAKRSKALSWIAALATFPKDLWNCSLESRLQLTRIIFAQTSANSARSSTLQEVSHLLTSTCSAFTDDDKPKDYSLLLQNVQETMHSFVLHAVDSTSFLLSHLQFPQITLVYISAVRQCVSVCVSISGLVERRQHTLLPKHWGI